MGQYTTLAVSEDCQSSYYLICSLLAHLWNWSQQSGGAGIFWARDFQKLLAGCSMGGWRSTREDENRICGGISWVVKEWVEHPPPKALTGFADTSCTRNKFLFAHFKSPCSSKGFFTVCKVNPGAHNEIQRLNKRRGPAAPSSGRAGGSWGDLGKPRAAPSFFPKLLGALQTASTIFYTSVWGSELLGMVFIQGFAFPFLEFVI